MFKVREFEGKRVKGFECLRVREFKVRVFEG